MRRAILACLAATFLCLGCGCWIRLPRRGPEAARQHIGKAGVLTRELVLINAFPLEPLMAYEVDAAKTLASGQHVVRRLSAGRRIKVEGITSRLGPMGVDYWYVCRDLVDDAKFDLGLEMLNALHLEKE